MSLNPEKSGLLWIDDLSGGLNDTDPPQQIADNQCQVAQNVEWVTTRFAQRRQGGVNPIGTEIWGAQTVLLTLMRHTPTADEGGAEMFGVNNAGPPVMGRLVASNNWASVAVGDAWTNVAANNANPRSINGVSFAGKFYIAGDTAVDRLHVWDGTSLRRVGLATPAAPTVGNTGAGTYAAIQRWYKVQWVGPASADGTRPRGELSAAVSFTPSGTGTAARLTRPALAGESELFWNVLGSPDNVNFYVIGSVAAGTTTFDDSTLPANYPTVLPGLAGYPTQADYYTAPISAKYLIVDEDRLILAGAWESASAASRVMWTPIIGTTPAAYGVDDSERVPSTNRLDLDRSDGGGITGLGQLNGSIYVFKLSHIYKLVRTGNATLPYQPQVVSKSLGAVSHKSIVLGEDDAGQPALYFISIRGPYRIGVNGLEYLGRDIETFWNTVNSLSSLTPPFGVWHQEKRQVQWWVTDSSGLDQASDKFVFHARHGHRTDQGVRGGWARHIGGAADAYSAVMFANTMGASMSLDLKPHVGQVWVSGLPDGPVIKYDADGVTTDRGPVQSAYVARAKSAAFPPGGRGTRGGVMDAYVLGTPSNRTLNVSLIRDFGQETRAGTVDMPAAVGTETRVQVPCEDTGMADADYCELIVDDESTLSDAAWTVDAVGLRVRVEAHR